MCCKSISYLPKLRLLETVVAAGTPNFNPPVVVVVRPNPKDGAAAVVLVDTPRLVAKVGRDAAGCPPPNPKLGAGANEKLGAGANAEQVKFVCG